MKIIKKKSLKIDLSNDDDQNNHLFADSAFANLALMTSFHSLMNSVIYDSDCYQTFIFDKNRFIDKIKSVNDFIKISNNHMKIARYETMLINARLMKKTFH